MSFAGACAVPGRAGAGAVGAAGADFESHYGSHNDDSGAHVALNALSFSSADVVV